MSWLMNVSLYTITPFFYRMKIVCLISTLLTILFFLYLVLVEVKDYFTGALRGYAVEVHSLSKLSKCITDLEFLLRDSVQDCVVKSRNTSYNFTKINLRGRGLVTDTV